MVLGLSAYYHDSAAALVDGGRIVAAAQEERFTRIKADARFPRHAIQYCLREAGLHAKELEAIVYYDKPWLTFERILDGLVQSAPRGFEQFRLGIDVWYRQKFFLKQILRREFKKHFGDGVGPLLKFSDHHLSHAASAFYPSPYESAAILTNDGVGEWATCTIGHGRGADIQTKFQMDYPHSWGLVYASFTQFLGFKVNSGEYKMMGLAPYASVTDPQVKNFCRIIESELLEVHSDGSLSVCLDQFEYGHGLRMVSPAKWEKLFGIKTREPESRLTLDHARLALAIQLILEKGVLRLAQTAKNETGERTLVMAGGVALNCVANGRLLREKIFDDVWVQPAADDAGGALGAAMAYEHLALKKPRRLERPDAMRSCYLGPDFSNNEIRALLDRLGLPIEELTESEMIERTASLLRDGAIIGWFQGRMEWGPRALGHRSILARADDLDMQKRLNMSIKFRETFRPFAPIVLEEDAAEIFDGASASPYMLFTFPLSEKWRRALPEGFTSRSIGEQLQTRRSEFQAITHMDFSSRLQTINGHSNPLFEKLLRTYKKKSGHSVLVNTSFNRRGEPIVCRPEDALRCYLKTDIDVLILQSFILTKKTLPKDVVSSLPAFYTHDRESILD